MTDTSKYFDDELTPEEEAAVSGKATAIEPSSEPAGGQPELQPQDNGQRQQIASEPAEDELEHAEEGDEDITTNNRDPKTGRFTKQVPIHALHKARAEHKATKERLSQQELKFARAEERMNTLLHLAGAQPNGQKPPAPQKPTNPFEEPTKNIDEDLLGYIDQVNRRLEYQNQQISSDRRTQHLREAEGAVRSAYLEDAKKFLSDEPAFRDAMAHLIGQRHAVLEAAGVSDKHQREKMIEQEEMQIVLQSFQGRKRPAEAMWKIALASGYAKGNGGPNPSHQQNVQRLQQQQRGMAASRSLSGAGKAAGALTISQIADMDQDEFERFVEQYGGESKFTSALG